MATHGVEIRDGHRHLQSCRARSQPTPCSQAPFHFCFGLIALALRFSGSASNLVPEKALLVTALGFTMLLSASKTVQENGSVVKPHLFKCAAYSNATLFEKKNSDLVVAMMAASPYTSLVALSHGDLPLTATALPRPDMRQLNRAPCQCGS
jgi:hypothetical protein